MTWFARQMQSYATDDLSISYKYDSDGLRTEKTVNGVKHEYYYVDGQLRYERNGDSYEIYYCYDADGRPALATKRDLVAGKNYQYYLITNTRGDVIETRNGNGDVNSKFTYDSWGKLISVTDGSGNELSTDSFAYQISLKYRGYVYDWETGLYYLQSRYYDPEVGRFLNADMDYILDASLLSSDLLCAIAESNLQVDMSLISAYSMRSSNIADGLTDNEKDYLEYSLTALVLFYQHGLPLEYLEGSHSWKVDTLYSNENQGYVKKIVFYSDFVKNNERQLYEIIFITGNAYAFLAYRDIIFQKNERMSIFSQIVFWLGIIFDVLGYAYPPVKVIQYIGYVLSILGIFGEGYSQGYDASISRFYDYISELASNAEGNDIISVLYKVTIITLRNGKETKEIIYEF